ncbi:MAG: apolipoprotein N-acyltransferase [Planctomycetes bacterium]|nr:apolipoprotein N-acyltransferase [Planctomycetota bacterium]
MVLLTACCIAASLLYGKHRLAEGQETITAGPIVTVIQDNVPQDNKQEEIALNGDEIFNRHMALSEAALEETPVPTLIVWPETMATSFLNDEFLAGEVSEYTKRSHEFNHRLKQLAGQGAAVLVGSPSITLSDKGGLNRYNSAQYYLADGTRGPKRYDKIHLVPFGEVVPFKKSWPWMYRLLNRLTPYDHEYSIEAGEHPTVFELTSPPNQTINRDMKETYRFGVAICYEDVMPHVPRLLAGRENGKKRIDFLLNISNEGWYIRKSRDGSIKATSELTQHLAICKFRAVENRVAIIRSVNMGISGFIRPDGQVQTKPLAGTLPNDPRQRQAVSGFLTDTVYLDSRVSIYNKTGDLFAILCTVMMTLLFLDGWLVRLSLRIKMKQEKTRSDEHTL